MKDSNSERRAQFWKTESYQVMQGWRFQCDPACKEQVLAVLKKALEKKHKLVFAYIFGASLGTQPFPDIGVYVTEEAGS
ncbi:MAG: hypothetical protein Q9M35_07925 [Rhodothermus sp.]|nr:hypothetical protein [Rhodothermus sp.]